MGFLLLLSGLPVPSIGFQEGGQYVGINGLPATGWWGLSTKTIDVLLATDGMATIGEVTYWTGGGRVSSARPAGSLGTFVWPQIGFNTNTQTNGPASAPTLFLATTSDNSGVCICACDLRGVAPLGGGVTPAFNAGGIALLFTPTIIIL